MKNLVIVESPTKARTIGRFLGKDYTIKASMGHVMDLPKSTLGVAVDDGFTPQYELVESKKQVLDELRKAAQEASTIILATDPDREGEAIASHVKDVLVSNKKLKINPPAPIQSGPAGGEKFKRIVFHEITKEAIEDALKHTRNVDENLVGAQTARRVLDRLVGYKLSPLLWSKIRRGLSAGRVQSVALRLIVEREKEIEKFKKEIYWTIGALLQKEKKDTEFELIEINGEKIEQQSSFALYDGEYKVTKTSITDEKKAQEIVSELQKSQFVVADVLQKETKRSPQPPYTTSTLQQDGSRRFGYSGKRTMSLAQKLYEEGYITYHRTDSVTVAASAISSTRSFIKQEYGDTYLSDQARVYITKQKLAQEAHEAIRPTRIQNLESKVLNDLGKDYGRLYGLIWRRAVASQMSDAVIESTTVVVDSQVKSSKFSPRVDAGEAGKVQSEKENTYRFKANGSVLVFDGFLKVNPQALQDNRLPKFTVSEQLVERDMWKTMHETTPPPRYNDASLIKTLEEKGIGRPSTYATIISTIEERQYVEKNEGRFLPTTVGVAVNDFLVLHFSDIDDIPFTAQMEDRLDEVAGGKEKWEPMIKEFYGPFEKKLESVKNAQRVKIEAEQVDETCPLCNAHLVIRIGRFGKFLACSTFPACKFTKPFIEQTNFVCPKDGGTVVIKKTRKGRTFYGCSNYPKCDFAAWKLKDIDKTSNSPLNLTKQTAKQ